MTQNPTYQDLERLVEELKAEKKIIEDRQTALVESQKRYERLLNTIPCAVYDYVRWPDGRTKFIYISSQGKNIFEHDIQLAIEAPDLLWNLVHPDDLERLKKEDLEANIAGEAFQSELRIILPSGKLKWIQITSMPSAQKLDDQVIWSGVVLDITERKKAEEERNRLVLDLQNALAEVKTLKGILPICSFCKKIRDDKGFWNQVDEYIAKHSDADLSHSVCPECAKKYYPDYDVLK